MTTQPPQSHFDLKPELFDALLGTELFKKQKESLFSNCGSQLNRLEGRNKSAMLVERASWVFIHPGYSAQLLPWPFSSLPPLCAHSAFLSISLKSIFFNQWVYFPPLTFCTGLEAVTYAWGFIPSSLTAESFWRRRWERDRVLVVFLYSTCRLEAAVEDSSLLFNSFADNKARKESKGKVYEKTVRYGAAIPP